MHFRDSILKASLRHPLPSPIYPRHRSLLTSVMVPSLLAWSSCAARTADRSSSSGGTRRALVRGRNRQRSSRGVIVDSGATGPRPCVRATFQLKQQPGRLFTSCAVLHADADSPVSVVSGGGLRLLRLPPSPLAGHREPPAHDAKDTSLRVLHAVSLPIPRHSLSRSPPSSPLSLRSAHVPLVSDGLLCFSKCIQKRTATIKMLRQRSRLNDRCLARRSNSRTAFPANGTENLCL